MPADPLNIIYRQADATSPLALDGESFDAIAGNDGLSAIDDLDAALGTIARVLRSDGVFVFSILHPCFPGWGADTPSAWPQGGLSGGLVAGRQSQLPRQGRLAFPYAVDLRQRPRAQWARHRAGGGTRAASRAGSAIA